MAGFIIESDENRVSRIKNEEYEITRAKQQAKIDAKREAKQVELEEKLAFLKRHSDNPEDLALAKEILGIKN